MSDLLCVFLHTKDNHFTCTEESRLQELFDHNGLKRNWNAYKSIPLNYWWRSSSLKFHFHETLQYLHFVAPPKDEHNKQKVAKQHIKSDLDLDLCYSYHQRQSLDSTHAPHKHLQKQKVNTHFIHQEVQFVNCNMYSYFNVNCNMYSYFNQK